MMDCLNCNKEFTPKRKSGKFCSASCRVKHSRIDKFKQSVTLKHAIHNTIHSTIVPNWKRLGISSKEDAIKYLLACLQKNRKRILDKGLGAPYQSPKIHNPGDPDLYNTVFTLGQRVFILDKYGIKRV